MKKKKKICSVSGCCDDPYLGGRCKKHHIEHSHRAECREKAVHALHTGLVDKCLPGDPDLRNELLRLRKWWDRACHSVQTQHDVDFMPFEEAEYALEWCISLAQEIIEAELGLRTGKTASDSLAATRYWVWDRFKNLENGLHSNGLPRNADK